MRTNFLAVVVSAIVYWMLGGLWFDWLFSKRWMALEHISEAQASSANPVWIWPFILTFLLNLIIAFVLAQVCIWRNANTAARGAAIGILLWLGIVGPIVYTTYMYEHWASEQDMRRQFHLIGRVEQWRVAGFA